MTATRPLRGRPRKPVPAPPPTCPDCARWPCRCIPTYLPDWDRRASGRVRIGWRHRITGQRGECSPMDYRQAASWVVALNREFGFHTSHFLVPDDKSPSMKEERP